MDCGIDELTNWLLYGGMLFVMVVMLVAIHLLVREVRRLRRISRPDQKTAPESQRSVICRGL